MKKQPMRYGASILCMTALLFVLGFYDYMYDDGQWASARGALA